MNVVDPPNLNPLLPGVIEKIDLFVIPAKITKIVVERKQNELINVFKNDVSLVNRLSAFFYETLAINYQDYTKGKNGRCARVPWITQYQSLNGKPYIMSSRAQFFLLKYIYQQQRNGLNTKSNFGYLMFSLGNYLMKLREAWNCWNTKQGNIVCYYYLGNNINSPQEMYNFLRKYVV
jgi:hypothetical protein